jgi:hypothetical protein
LSWCVSLLPHIEQKEIFEQFDLKAGVQDVQNRAAAEHQIRLYLCPSSAEFGRYRRDNALADPISQYVGVAGVGANAALPPLEHPRSGAFGYDRRRSLETGFPDGTSSTLMLLETGLNNGHWAHGGEATIRAVEPEQVPLIGRGRPFGGFHPASPPWFGEDVQTCNAAMADGSVRVIRPTVAPEVLAALATAGGREELPKDW